MNVVGGLMVRRDRPSFVSWFPDHLKNLMPLLDHLYVRIDKTGKDVTEFLEPYRDKVTWEYQFDHPGDNYQEDRERQAILDWMLGTGAKWGFAFDADEVLEEGAAEALRAFLDADPHYRILSFPLNYSSHHRVDYVLDRSEPDEGNGVTVGRGFRLDDPEIRQWRYKADKDGLHCGTLPGQERKSTAILKEIVTVHYHACSPLEWQQKRDFYDNTEEVRKHGGIEWLYRCDRFGKEEHARPYSEIVANKEERFAALMKRLERAA